MGTYLYLGSYWQKTSAAESLMTYFNMDFDGLQELRKLKKIIDCDTIYYHV